MILPKSVRQSQGLPYQQIQNLHISGFFDQWRDRAHESTWALIERHSSAGNQVTEADQS